MATEDRKSPTDTIIEAMGKADEMEDVLIIWSGKNGARCGSVDNDISVAESLYLIELFRTWISRCMLKEEKGDDG